jgi:transitional endoplasmic reticulum ATPase
MSVASRIPRIELMPLVPRQEFEDLLYRGADDSLILRELLNRAPALSTKPIDADLMNFSVNDLSVTVANQSTTVPLYIPPGMTVRVGPNGSLEGSASVEPPSAETGPSPAAPLPESSKPAPRVGIKADQPMPVQEGIAVRLAYAREIDVVASFLRVGLSVLVICDKLVVEHLWEEIVRRANKDKRLLDVDAKPDSGMMPRGLRQRQLEALRDAIKDMKRNEVLVIPHLDLLAGGAESNPSTEARELVELVYAASDRLMLAFADRTLPLPEVLAARFAARALISGVSRTVVYPDGTEQSLGQALVAPEEAERFDDFDPEGLYKNVAGMNPVRLRHAICYAVKEQTDKAKVPVDRLYRAIREFKAKTSTNFEVPNVTFDDIGGYADVKAEMMRALRIMTETFGNLDAKLQHELIPRGFIFYGPPGTGKTLFAKAIANQLNATIQVVSGPEITDMYVGESERKVREIFAEARRNAPAVLVFDEFDSIATKRSGRDDGGSRAGNAVVAQILTEMDGFRPDVTMLVIGTTNRLDIIDDALLRPSRFQAIEIGMPDATARRAIARVHAGHFGIPVPAELLQAIALATANFNGDEIRSLFRDACLGAKCEHPPIPPDARRLGMLVGRIRLAVDKRRASAASRRVESGPPPPRGGRLGPSGPMSPMNTRSSSPADASAPPAGEQSPTS